MRKMPTYRWVATQLACDPTVRQSPRMKPFENTYKKIRLYSTSEVRSENNGPLRKQRSPDPPKIKQRFAQKTTVPLRFKNKMTVRSENNGPVVWNSQSLTL